jgi:hypothetical protein
VYKSQESQASKRGAWGRWIGITPIFVDMGVIL